MDAPACRPNNPINASRRMAALAECLANAVPISRMAGKAASILGLRAVTTFFRQPRRKAGRTTAVQYPRVAHYSGAPREAESQQQRVYSSGYAPANPAA
jgi:hypothetical protein